MVQLLEEMVLEKISELLVCMKLNLSCCIIVIVITLYSPSCLGQETAKESFTL